MGAISRIVRDVCLALLLAAACGESAPSGGVVCQGDAECSQGQVCRGGLCGPPGIAADAGLEDGGGLADGGLEDGGGLADGGLDAGASDAGIPDAGASDAGRLAGLGERCTAHADCESQICLPTSQGSICTRQCSADCPGDQVCKAFVLDRNRIVNLCVPFGDVYCVACRASVDCPGAGDRCTDVAGATYCTRDCSGTGVCPPGFECRDVPHAQTAEGQAAATDGGLDGGDGPVYRQCMPASGECPGCIDLDGDGYGAGADCLGPDCDDRDRAVNPAAAEICDGRDNNCDGRIDEGFDLSSNDDHCGRCGARCDVAGGERCCEGSCVAIASSLAHCGGCGHACSVEGEACCSGQCRDTRFDVGHCGACGIECANPNGTTRCEAGRCAPTCAPGYGDCNGNPRDGCETDLSLVTTCGACELDPDCPDGFYCSLGVCRKKKPRGEDCGRAGECQSGFCANGVCCNSECAGICRSCALEGTRGSCTFVPPGQDPDDECPMDAPSTCGRDGSCDGLGSCRLWSSATVCVAQSCANGVQTNTRWCDGAGHCAEALPPTTSCAPYTCNGSFACHASCVTDDECAVGYRCSGGVCRSSSGQPCSRGEDCASGYCADGVCCNEACNGTCERCDLPSSLGTCAAAPAGTDPDNECTQNDPSTCGQTGLCSGTRGLCQLYPSGYVCQAQRCETGTQTNARTCDGLGNCVAGTPPAQSCHPYVCTSDGTRCHTSCASDAECATGYGCAGGVCKKKNGQNCAVDDECASGFCTGGVCCEARCAGTCESCNQPGRLGFCDPLPGPAITTCDAAQSLGSLSPGFSATTPARTLPNDDMSHWYVVEFPPASATFGGGLARIRLSRNDDGAFRIEVLGTCTSTLGCGAGSSATTATNLTDWSFTDNQSTPGPNQWSTRNVPWPSQVRFRVYRVTSGRSCAGYQVEVTR